MKIQAGRTGPYRVVILSGSADAEACGLLKQAFLDAIEAGDFRIICDLTGADFLCSDALGVLITAYVKVRGRGGCLLLAGPPAKLREILETTRLNHLFEVFPTVNQAAAKA